MSIEIKKLPPLGAEVVGADVDTLLSDERIPSLVLDALEENSVLVFRELGFDDAQQVAFARRLGDIAVKRGSYGQGGDYPEIYHVGFGDELTNALVVKGAFHWHLDGTTDEIPSKASLLSGRSLSKSGGGDTQFVSTYKAYDRLSDEDKRRVADLKVQHSVESAYRHVVPDPPADVVEQLRALPSRIHPLVWTHHSGRRSLVLGTTAERVDGLPDDEGAALLARLVADATAPEHVLTHTWSVGDLVIWDNRGTLHQVTPYAEDSGRMMHRITLAGDEPIQ